MCLLKGSSRGLHKQICTCCRSTYIAAEAFHLASQLFIEMHSHTSRNIDDAQNRDTGLHVVSR